LTPAFSIHSVFLSWLIDNVELLSNQGIYTLEVGTNLCKFMLMRCEYINHNGLFAYLHAGSTMNEILLRTKLRRQVALLIFTAEILDQVHNVDNYVNEVRKMQISL
jgi:hypothetical protein